MTSHWTYKGKQINSIEDLPKGMFGFVYMITNIETDMKYIGKKQLGSRRRKALTKAQKKAGRKRRTVVYSESNWKTYTSSSKEVNADIKKSGKDKFKFEILIFGKTKGQCNYIEEYFQMTENVILNTQYYNDAVGSGKFRNVKTSEAFLKSLKEVII